MTNFGICQFLQVASNRRGSHRTKHSKNKNSGYCEVAQP